MQLYSVLDNFNDFVTREGPCRVLSLSVCCSHCFPG